MKLKSSFGIGVLIIFLVFTVYISGCTSDRDYEQPSKVTEPTRISSEKESSTSETSLAAQEEEPKIEIFNVGETATDGELEVTLNNIRYARKIDERNDEFYFAEAPEGKQYVIVDLTVKNILKDKTQIISTFDTEVIDSDGYAYDTDLGASIALDKPFKDGDLLPGMKRRGEIAYEIPVSAKDLKFIYKFDVLGATAVFNLS